MDGIFIGTDSHASSDNLWEYPWNVSYWADGSNHSINALYSGTLHGAMEGTIQGIPSISFSHLSYSEKTKKTNCKIKYEKLLASCKVRRECLGEISAVLIRGWIANATDE